MPTPSAWAIGVAAPSGFDPYQDIEASTSVPGRLGGPGSLTFGTAGGEVVSPSRKLKGHWTEMMDWRGSPAIWVLAAILLAVGVLHLGAGVRVGNARASVEA